jgi:Xaa-Pro aminopeptidase
MKSTVDSFIFQNGMTIKINSTKPFMHNLRVIKSASEIELMRTTCRIGGEAIAETISHENTINHQGLHHPCALCVE